VAFEDIKDLTSTTILLFVEMDVYDRDAETTTTLYFGEAEVTTDQVDGTLRHWEGRVNGWSTDHPDPPIGQSRWSHPVAELSVWLGPEAGDHADDLWDYFTDDHQWDGAACTVRLVDMSQAAGAGARDEIIGTIQGHPDRLQASAFFRLHVEGNHFGKRLTCNRLGVPTKYDTGIVQPARQDPTTPDEILNGAVTAADTSWVLTTFYAAFENVGRVVKCENELVYIGAYDIPTKTLSSLIRGYAGTTAASHANGTEVHVFRNGPHPQALAGASFGSHLPFIFGQQASNRGIIIEPYAISNTDVGATGNVEFYFSRGEDASAHNQWSRIAGAYADDGNPVTYNDFDSVFPDVAGTGYHYEPWLLLAGCYTADASIQPAVSGWASNADGMWLRVSGVQDGAAHVHRYACGVANYLAVNQRWGCALSSPFVAGVITAWDSGAWADEYSEAFYENIEGIIPAFGDTADPPYLCDALQELCDLVSSDLFVRGGLLYPKRRKVAATADFTVEPYHIAGAKPLRLRDPQSIYCNKFTLATDQTVYTEPDVANTSAPVPVPYTALLRSDDEITAFNKVVSKSRSTRWFRLRMSEAYDPTPGGTDGVNHIEYLEGAAKEMMDHRAQAQVWYDAVLTESCAFLQQGDTIDFNIDGITTTSGQLRGIRKTRPQSQTQLPPIEVRTLSWHINF
jgi:hypothetical protein